MPHTMKRSAFNVRALVTSNMLQTTPILHRTLGFKNVDQVSDPSEGWGPPVEHMAHNTSTMLENGHYECFSLASYVRQYAQQSLRDQGDLHRNCNSINFSRISREDQHVKTGKGKGLITSSRIRTSSKEGRGASTTASHTLSKASGVPSRPSRTFTSEKRRLGNFAVQTVPLPRRDWSPSSITFSVPGSIVWQHTRRYVVCLERTFWI